MDASDASITCDIADLIRRQSEYFASGATLDVSGRLDCLVALEQGIRRNEGKLLDALAEDLGKPRIEAYLAEIHFLLTEIRFFRRNLRHWARPKRVRSPLYFFPSRSEIRREPLGRALIVAPWNYPIQLSLSPLVAAVAAGNGVILKPSEAAPRTAARLAELIGDVFSDEHVAVVQGGAETGRALLEQRYDCIFYTGSGRIARLVAESAARHLTPTVLELGGKCPCIVDTDCDLDKAAERIAAGKFFNAGQTCFAPDFVAIPRPLADVFAEKIAALLRQWFADPDDLARIVSDSHFERLEALAEGESTLAIGQDDRKQRRMAPRIVRNADWNHPAMREEIFGPVLPIVPYENLDDLLTTLRSMDAPLALYAFSHRKSVQEKIARALPSGSVCFNDTMKQATNLRLPFGGVGPSGMGRYRGEAGFDAFTYARAVTRRRLGIDPFRLRPPYAGVFEKMRRFLR